MTKPSASYRRRNWPSRLARPLGVLLIGSLGAACNGSGGDPTLESGHAHGGGEMVTLWSDSLELFMEYPPQVAGQPSEPWAVHLTWLDDWQPVREGTLSLRLTGRDGASIEVEESAPTRPGIFTPAPDFPAHGAWAVDMVLTARGREYPISVGQIEVFESHEALPRAADEESSAGIAFLKEQQWEIPFGAASARTREIRPSVPVAGSLEAPPGALAEVSAPVTGIVVADGPMPAPGDPVSTGQTLAVLAPVSGESSYAALVASVERLQREVARAERLAAVEAIPQKRLVEVRHDLAVARAALEALGGPALEAGQDPSDPRAYRYRLRSPISGVLSERWLTPGQRVEAGARGFTVVNPGTLWLRLHLPARLAESAEGATGAVFTVEGGARFHRAEQVISVASVIDPATRTLPVLLSVPNPELSLKVGMLAEGSLFVGAPEAGVAVPASAIQDEEGLAVVFVELAGETFERRVIEPGPTDGEWTIVRSGVSEGERVVTAGAYQVHLASLGEAAPTDHGHPH